MKFDLKNLSKKQKDEIIKYLLSCTNYKGIVVLNTDNENNLIITKEV